MKPGTIVRLPDGREGTVVYNSLVGYGIRWGRLTLSVDDVEAILIGDGNTVRGSAPVGWLFEPEAYLREPFLGASLPCVGTDYEVIGER